MCGNMGEVTLQLWSVGVPSIPQVRGVLCMPISTIMLHPPLPSTRPSLWGRGLWGRSGLQEAGECIQDQLYLSLGGRGGGEAVEVWLGG